MPSRRKAKGRHERGGPGHGTDRLFLREGDYWTIVYEGTVLRLRDTKGMRYLAELLGHPGERVAALDLLARARTVGAQNDAERARLAVTKRIKASLQKLCENHPALGFHLATTIKTGRSCTYRPDPTRPVSWTFSRS